MSGAEDAYCPCGHSLDAHSDSCLVPDCSCKRTIEQVETLNIRRMSAGLDVLTRDGARAALTPEAGS